MIYKLTKRDWRFIFPTETPYFLNLGEGEGGGEGVFLVISDMLRHDFS